MYEEQRIAATGRFKRILLATDGSEFSVGAEVLTTAMALRFGGDVTVMQVVLFNPELDTLSMTLLQQQEGITLQSLSEVKARMARQGVNCALLVKRSQHPYQEIIDAAIETDADLVIMGRRGRRGLARLMLGDTTARVVAQSPRPVLVGPKGGGVLWTTSILLATDGSHFSDRAAVEAIILAREAGLPLRVVSVVESKENVAHFETARMVVEQVVVQAREAGVMVQGVVVEGNSPSDAIAEEARNSGAGLIVGGSHGRTGLGLVFIGSVMERLLGKVSCPVMVIKGRTS